MSKDPNVIFDVFQDLQCEHAIVLASSKRLWVREVSHHELESGTHPFREFYTRLAEVNTAVPVEAFVAQQ